MKVKFLETKHERNSASITALIVLILLLLLFVVGPQYMDPPEEYGVAVNFGTTDFGSGDQALSEPREAVEEKVVEESQPEKTIETPAPAEASTKAEDVMTQDNAEAIAIKKQKEADAKAKAEADAKAEAEAKVKAAAEKVLAEKREAEEKKRREEAEKRKNLDNLIGGVKNANGNTDGGEGPDSKGGNKGQLDGDPYAPSYFRGSGPGKGGVGYGLGGRGKPTNGKVIPDCQETGIVVVEVRVNRDGKVIKADPGKRGTTGTQCLFEAARKTALTFKWPANSEAPVEQIGFVSINFDLGQ